MADLGIFNSTEFDCAQLSDAIEVIPTVPGLIGQLNIFPMDPVRTTSFMVEREVSSVNVLSVCERGGPAPVNDSDKRDVRYIDIPHFKLTDRITAAEIQNIRAFGSTSEFKQVAQEVNRKLQKMKLKHEATLEYLRAGGLQGIIKDGSGKVLLNLYTAFGISRPTVDFKFGIEGNSVDTKFRNVLRLMEENLNGEVMNGAYCLCGKGWFERFIKSPAVVDAYKYYAATLGNQAPAREDVRNHFYYQGINVVEYNYRLSSKNGVLEFIPENEAVFFPTGTMDSFSTKLAPADFMESVNTPGQFVYAKQAPDKWNIFVELLTQSNPLPICIRPELLVRGVTSD